MANNLIDPDKKDDDALVGKPIDDELAGIEQATDDADALRMHEPEFERPSISDNKTPGEPQVSPETKPPLASDLESKAPTADETREQSAKVSGSDNEFNYHVEGRNKPQKLMTRVSSNRKKFALVGGGATGIIGIVMAIFIALLPLKLDFILANITSQVAEIPEYAIEKRMDYLVGRYINRTILSRADGTRDVIVNRNTLAGNMFANWRAAKLELKIENEFGIRFESDFTSGIGNDRTGWKIIDTATNTEIINSPNTQFSMEALEHAGGGNSTFNSRQLRKRVKDFVVADSLVKQTYKRFQVRRLLTNKYGVRRWNLPQPIENARLAYNQKKLNFLKATNRKVIGAISPKYGAIIGCLLGGGDGCKGLSSSDRDLLRDTGGDIENYPQDSIDELPEDQQAELKDNNRLNGDSVAEASENAFDSLSPDDANFAKKVVSFFSREIVRTVIKTLSVVALIDSFARVYGSVQSGALTQVQYAMNSAAYANVFSHYSSLNDQLKSGDLESDNVSLAMESLNDFETSPVYQTQIASANGTNVALAASVWEADCDGDGEKEPLPAGETVCESKKAAPSSNGLEAALNSGPAAPVRALVNTYNKTVGSVVGAFIDVFDNTLGKVTEAAISVVPGATEAMEKAISFLVNLAFSPATVGVHTGPDLVNDIYAGGEITYNDTMASAGGRNLSTAEVTQLQAAIDAEQDAEWAQRSFWVRLTSTEDTRSLLAKAITSTPSSLRSASSTLMAFINPVNRLALATNVFDTSYAATNPATPSPFNVPYYGFPVNDPLTYDEDGCSTEAASVSRKTELLSDDIRIPVYNEVDYCAFEELVTSAGSTAYTNTSDLSINDDTASNTAAGSVVVGDPYESSVDVACDPRTNDLGIHGAYVKGSKVQMRLCGIPNISSTSSESSPDSTYYIAGANRDAIVNSRVSGALFSMVEAAKAEGVSLSANSSFRTMQHQQRLFASNGGDTSLVARPGFSSHQAGVAIDFSGMSVKGGSSCAARAKHGGALYRWLYNNAEKFGYEQYAKEAWHWDMLDSSNRCNSSEG